MATDQGVGSSNLLTHVGQPLEAARFSRGFSLLLKTDLFKKQEEQTFRQGLMWSSLDEVRAVPVNRRGGFYYNKFEIRILKFSKIALGISWLNG